MNKALLALTPLAAPRAWWQSGYALALLAACGFSLKAIFVKLGYAAGPVDALSLLALRMLLALPAFAWLCTRGEPLRLSTRQILGLMLMSMLGYYLASLFDFIGLLYISAGLERLILFTYPSLVLLFEAIWRRRSISKHAIAAMLLCYLGLFAAFWHDLQHTEASREVILGGAWVMLSSLSFSLYYLGSSHYVKLLGSSKFTGLAGALACGFVLGHFTLLRSPADLFNLPLPVWGWALAMALISTVLPIWAASSAVARLGASKAASMGTLGPVLTIVFGWWILQEPFSLMQLLGLALVVGGVSWMSKAK